MTADPAVEGWGGRRQTAPPSAVSEGDPTLLLQAQNIDKSFGATRAVRDVSLKVAAGSVVGLVGENGAGKSTLARVLAGVHAPDRGELLMRGAPVSLRNPQDGLRVGISFMAQEIALVPEASVIDNVLLAGMPRRGPFPDRRRMRARFAELQELSGFDLDPSVRVSRLRVADQQKVEILRSIAHDAQLIIMDEPSAALTADEIARLHSTVRALTARGASVLLISHFLEEVLELADEVIVMRDGAVVRQAPAQTETVNSLVTAMVGRELSTAYAAPLSVETGAVRLAVHDLCTVGLLDRVSFQIKSGEILGLAGLIGSGRTEIARAIFGADPVSAGSISIDGTESRVRHPAEGLGHGIFMVPESRKDQGLLLEAPISDNLNLATYRRRARAGILRRTWLRDSAEKLAREVDLRYGRLDQPVASLSGGNQQKVLFGRAKSAEPRVLIVDEPTRGVDVAAKRAIHATLEEQAKQGVAVLFISSDLEEVLGVCHRVIVVHRGRIHAEFHPPYHQQDVVAAFFGQSRESA